MDICAFLTPDRSDAKDNRVNGPLEGSDSDLPAAAVEWLAVDHRGRVVPTNPTGEQPMLEYPHSEALSLQPVRVLDDSLPLCPEPPAEVVPDTAPADLLPSTRPSFGALPRAEDSPLRPTTFHTMYASLVTVMQQYQ
eukprot:TRINITY_DN16640_c0_g1_i1.p1 TRINITY_DN16640_c0_g1~~TRINITY_DN16640_c0_g1_i1.p1  ORF type:complete len:137 (-),score=11.67 TRINITY_DN16640_c0_g1_i1:31-441(-)